MKINTFKVDGFKKLCNVYYTVSTVGDRKDDYPLEKIKFFPSKNSTKLTSFLIKEFSKEGQVVLDPMCGSGTTAVEAIKLKRLFRGVDIHSKNVLLTQTCIEFITHKLNFFPRTCVYVGNACKKKNYTEEVNLVLFSPPYGLQNHSTGTSKKQTSITMEKSLYSCQDYGVPNPYDLAKQKNLDHFYGMMDAILHNCKASLVKNGHICIILQDYVRKGKQVGLVQNIANMMISAKFKPVGYIERELKPSFFKTLLIRKGHNVVCVEHTLVGKV